eukprot:Gb_17622 [translate_table: standard]
MQRKGICGVKKQRQRCGDSPEFVLTSYQGTHNQPPKSATSSTSPPPASCELRNSYDLRSQLCLPKCSEDRPGDDETTALCGMCLMKSSGELTKYYVSNGSTYSEHSIQVTDSQPSTAVDDSNFIGIIYSQPSIIGYLSPR